MQDLFNDLIGQGLEIYLDDVLIYADSEEEMIELLGLLFDRFVGSNMTVNIEKCLFFAKELTFLGHKFGNGGVTADSNKIQALTDMPEPNTVQQLQHFLAAAGFLRSYGIISQDFPKLLSHC